MDRGIIVPGLKVGSSSSAVMRVDDSVGPEILRYLVLYWDKIIVVDSFHISQDKSEELKTLKQAGVSQFVTAAKVGDSVTPSELRDSYAASIAAEAEKHISKNPGQWAIHQNDETLILPKGQSKELITAEFYLNSCLPVPLKTVPIEKVLDFKVRRQSELISLRSSLDELYLEIANSADIPRSRIVQIQKLEQSIKDLDQVAREDWRTRLLASRKVSLDINFQSLLTGSTSGALIGQSFSSPLLGVISGVASTLVSGVNFEVAMSSQLRSPIGRQIDLSYLSSLKEEDLAN